MRKVVSKRLNCMIKISGVLMALLLTSIPPVHAEDNTPASTHVQFLTTAPNEGRDKYLRVAVLLYDDIYALRIDEMTGGTSNEEDERLVASYFLEGNDLIYTAIKKLTFVEWVSWNEFEIQSYKRYYRIRYEPGKGFKPARVQVDEKYPIRLPKFQYEPTEKRFIDQTGSEVVTDCEGEGCISEGRYVVLKAAPVYSSPNTSSNVVSRLIPGELIVGAEQVHAIPGIAKIVGKFLRYDKPDKSTPDMDLTKPFSILAYQGEGWTHVRQGAYSYSIKGMPEKCGSRQQSRSCLEVIREHKKWVWVSITGRDRKLAGWVLRGDGVIRSIESCMFC